MGEVGPWAGGGGVGKHPATDELAPSQVNSLHAVENDSPVTRVHRYISFSIRDSLVIGIASAVRNVMVLGNVLRLKL